MCRAGFIYCMIINVVDQNFSVSSVGSLAFGAGLDFARKPPPFAFENLGAWLDLFRFQVQGLIRVKV